jgi:hypothetical protein
MEADAHSEEGETATALPEGLRELWREACAWAGWLFGALDLAMLRGPGVDRTFGAKISGEEAEGRLEGRGRARRRYAFGFSRFT